MTTEYKLNVYLEWTKEDLAKGECPVPDGSDATVWFGSGDICRNRYPELWDWGEYGPHVKAYLIHSVPREPMFLWHVANDEGDWAVFKDKVEADSYARDWGGRVAKLVEEME